MASYMMRLDNYGGVRYDVVGHYRPTCLARMSPVDDRECHTQCVRRSAAWGRAY
jgi:hypothetical protein